MSHRQRRTMEMHKDPVMARKFLGLGEGGLIGDLVIYIATFYQRHKLALRISFPHCIPISGFIGGLLPTGHDQTPYAGCQ